MFLENGTPLKRGRQLEKLLTVAEKSNNAVLILDKNGHFEWANEGFIKMFGFTLTEWIERNGKGIIHNKGPALAKKIGDAIQERKTLIYESLSTTKENGRIWTHTTLTPVLDDNGELQHFIVIDSDINELKKKEKALKAQQEELQQKEAKLKEITESLENLVYELAIQKEQLEKANVTKDKLFRMIAHDLRSPFTALIGFSGLLMQKYDKLSREQIMEYLRFIDTSAKHTFALLENLLYWAKSQTNEITAHPEDTNTIEITKESFDLFRNIAASKNITFKYNIAEPVALHTDKNMMNTVVRNLISNAIKFTYPEGEVSVFQKIDSEYVAIIIKDNGIGMDKKALKQLFNPSERQSRRGTYNEKGHGLGLMIVKEFIELNHGKLLINSDINKGSEFTVFLPLKRNLEDRDDVS